MVVARGTKSGTLYTTAGCMNRAVVAESASNSSIWHNRLGHMSVKGMKMSAAEEVLEGLKSVDMSPCENCVMSKQKRVSFTKTARELKKSIGTMKQVGVEVEFLKDSPSDVVADTQEAHETVVKKPETDQMTPEQVLERSSRAIRVLDRYIPFLHYRLVTDEGEREPLVRPYNWRIQLSGSKPYMMGCLGFRNALPFPLLRLST